VRTSTVRLPDGASRSAIHTYRSLDRSMRLSISSDDRNTGPAADVLVQAHAVARSFMVGPVTERGAKMPTGEGMVPCAVMASGASDVAAVERSGQLLCDATEDNEPPVDVLLVEEALVEEVSIDGMCGVY
jgi:mycofactocin precursor